MKRTFFAVLVAVTVVVFAMAGIGIAQEGKTAKKERTARSLYFVQLPHTPEECLKAMDEVVAKSSKLLAKVNWACMAGDHTGYAFVEAASESAVRDMLPASQRDKARIVKVNKFTAEQIKSFHEK